MNMKELIFGWFAWLKQATAAGDGQLSHVYSDGRRLWATNGYVLHALEVATERSGRVTLDDEGLLQVEKVETLPPFAGTLPRGEPTAAVVVSAAALRRAAAGQEGFVRLAIYGEARPLELAGDGRYALVMPVLGTPEELFRQPAG